jgi:hypothetical protein
MKKCDKVMQIDCHLKILPETVLQIANTEKWLLQPELKAIKDGLTYGTKEGYYRGWKWTYSGYLNAQGQKEGVGIFTLDSGEKTFG